MALSHQCPQCGAPVELRDTDRIFACPFCRVRLFLHADGPLRYFLPPRVSGPGRLIYIPYWRLRGSAFVLDRERIQHKILDTNLLAADLPGLPPSLGIRPQTLATRFVEPDTEGFFLRPEYSGAEFKTRLLHRVFGATRPAPPHLEACVGDVVSVVYLPVFQDKELLDGISGRVLGPDCLTTKNADTVRLSFTSALCPQCGWDLEGDTQSLIQTCAHCHTSWKPGGSIPEPVSVRFLGSPANGRYLPFWCLRVTGQGFPLQSWADLVRLAELPQIVQPWMEKAPCIVRLPAFKIKPSLFLSLCARMSFCRVQSAAREPLSTPLHPVTLPQEEALEALPVILANFSASRAHILEKLQHGSLRLEEAHIEYALFVWKNGQWCHPETNMALQANALHWATTM